MLTTIRRELSGVARNLRGGARLLFFRTPAGGFQYSLHQVVLLTLVGVLLAATVDYLRYLPDPQFNLYAISGETLALAGVLLVAYLVAVSMGDASKGLQSLVQILSIAPFIYLLGVALQGGALQGATSAWIPGLGPLELQWAAYGVVLLWILAVIGFILYAVSGRRLWRAGVYLATYVMVVIVPPFFIWSGDYWYPTRDAEADGSSVYDQINQEQLYYAQPDLLAAATRRLAPGRPGIADLYFVGFGGDGEEDVFMKEVRFAQRVFDAHFDTQRRSLALINNPATMGDTPLATYSNLNRALAHVGRIMDREEDVLFLFMTSHGSRKHELSVNFPNLRLNHITPTQLKAALDAAGIKWRVLVVSACYSGGFVEPLHDDYTLIATAAAADKTSFGCGTASDFTYFGKALLDEQLQTEYYLPAALEKAAESIKAREAAERKEHSDPRLSVGRAIAPKLRELEQRLTRGTSGAYAVAGAR